MSKQTAVEWLFEQIPLDYKLTRSAFDAFQQAKAIEREQIKEAYSHGQNNGYMYVHDKAIDISKENYYNRTFNTESKTNNK